RAAIHRQRGNILVVEKHRAEIGRDQPGDDVEACRFAGAVRAQQPHHLAALHRDVDVAQYRPLLEALAEIVGDEAAIIENKARPARTGSRHVMLICHGVGFLASGFFFGALVSTLFSFLRGMMNASTRPLGWPATAPLGGWGRR